MTLTTQGPIVSDDIVAACVPWSAILHAGWRLQIIDLHGNQAVDTPFYGVRAGRPDPAKRYSAQVTVASQRNIFLGTGCVLRATDGTPLVTIVADEVGNHDTIAGGVFQGVEHAALRPSHRAPARLRGGLPRRGRTLGHGQARHRLQRQLLHERAGGSHGTLGIVDGLSAPGKSPTLRAETYTLVLVSNCPQINNPCNGLDPTPVRMVISRR